jgi:iron complex transport system permease protein
LTPSRLALALFALLVLACGLSLLIGPAALSPADVMAALSGSSPPWMRAVVLEVRLPRVFLAALGGGALAISGHALQGLFRNPLADPSVLGVSSGATLGAVATLYLGTALTGASLLVAVPAAAFVVALATATLVYRLAARGPVVSTTSLVLAGLALSSLASALTSLVLAISLADWELGRQVLSWMLGGLEDRTLAHLYLCAPLVVVPTLGFVPHLRALDALALGEEHALSVGVDVARLRRDVLVLASLLTAATVSVMGALPFVGLVVPHAARRLVGPAHARSLPISALLGAALLVIADTLSRAAAGSFDLRPGVLTSLVGAPFFVLLLARAATSRDEEPT